jgi:hypothetical protein
MKRVLLLILTTLLTFSGCAGEVEPKETETEDITVSEVFEEAYENTAALESYSMEAEISLRKLVIESSVSGIIKKENNAYTGSVIVKVPGKKYSYTYSSPYDGKDTNVALISDSGNKFLSFNIADIGEGVICSLSEEIIETGEFTNRAKTEIECSVTNEQAEALYGDMIDFFKDAEKSIVDLSDLYFTSGSIDVRVEDGIIRDYTVTLRGESKIGKITCQFSCTVI